MVATFDTDGHVGHVDVHGQAVTDATLNLGGDAGKHIIGCFGDGDVRY